jgi:hypothetical protein
MTVYKVEFLPESFCRLAVCGLQTIHYGWNIVNRRLRLWRQLAFDASATQAEDVQREESQPER